MAAFGRLRPASELFFQLGFFNQGVARMKSVVRNLPKLKLRGVVCLALGLAAVGCASDPRPVVVGQPMAVPTLNDYCAIAQKEIATSRVPARNVLVTDFQASRPDGPKLFVLSLKAGGTGLNLTAANRVFHYDLWWNPAVEDQATDRAFRIGQQRNVFVH
jgi:hypothetical protein